MANLTCMLCFKSMTKLQTHTFPGNSETSVTQWDMWRMCISYLVIWLRSDTCPKWAITCQLKSSAISASCAASADRCSASRSGSGASKSSTLVPWGSSVSTCSSTGTTALTAGDRSQRSGQWWLGLPRELFYAICPSAQHGTHVRKASLPPA